MPFFGGGYKWLNQRFYVFGWNIVFFYHDEALIAVNFCTISAYP